MKYAFILATAILVGCKDNPKPGSNYGLGKTIPGKEFKSSVWLTGGNDTSYITTHPDGTKFENLPLGSNWKVVRKVESKDSTVYSLVYTPPTPPALKERYFLIHYTVRYKSGEPDWIGDIAFINQGMFSRPEINAKILAQMKKTSDCYQYPMIDWIYEFNGLSEYSQFIDGESGDPKPKKRKGCCEPGYGISTPFEGNRFRIDTIGGDGPALLNRDTVAWRPGDSIRLHGMLPDKVPTR